MKGRNVFKTAWKSFDYSALIEIEPDNQILDGHQRDSLMTLMPAWGPDRLIEVRVASRKFTDEERRKYFLYKERGARGKIDLEMLVNDFDMEEIEAFGGSWPELDEFGREEELYSRNVDAPDL